MWLGLPSRGLVSSWSSHLVFLGRRPPLRLVSRCRSIRMDSEARRRAPGMWGLCRGRVGGGGEKRLGGVAGLGGLGLGTGHDVWSTRWENTALAWAWRIYFKKSKYTSSISSHSKEETDTPTAKNTAYHSKTTTLISRKQEVERSWRAGVRGESKLSPVNGWDLMVGGWVRVD